MSTELVASILGAGKYAEPIERAAIEFGILSPLAKSHFIAQLAHESDGFRTSVEYASGRAYEGRKDLGNTQPGDGVRYKGRGLIQLTGRANYTAAGRALGLDLIAHPELAEKPRNAARIAGWYWNSRKITPIAERDDLVGVTKKINGGTKGLADRAKWLDKAKAEFRKLGADL